MDLQRDNCILTLLNVVYTMPKDIIFNLLNAQFVGMHKLSHTCTKHTYIHVHTAM